MRLTHHIHKLLLAAALLAALAAVAALTLPDTRAHAAASPAAVVPQVRTGPSAPVQAWSRAVENGDSAALLRMNIDTTVAFPPDAMVRRGGRQIVAGYTALFEKYNAAVQISDAHFIESAGLVHSWGLYTLTLTAKTGGGEPVTLRGRFSDIATQVNGQWHYILDHASLPAAK